MNNPAQIRQSLVHPTKPNLELHETVDAEARCRKIANSIHGIPKHKAFCVSTVHDPIPHCSSTLEKTTKAENSRHLRTGYYLTHW